MKTGKAILLFFLISVSVIRAQDTTTKVREFYIALGGYNPLNFQLKYKAQTGKRTLFKIGLVDLGAYAADIYSANPNNFSGNYSTNYSAGIEVGLELRKNMHRRFAFYHGPNLRFTYRELRMKHWNFGKGPEFETLSKIFTGALPYTAGIIFNIARHFYLSAEINPAITFSQHYVTTADPNTGIPANYGGTDLGIGLSNNSAVISLVYRR